MVQKLRELGVMIEWSRVQELAQGAVGRPHVAQAMLEGGYITSMNEAFDRYLGRNGPAYVERAKLTPAEAVAAIRGVGGVAVLAHPRDVLANLDPILDDLCAAGLTGMEVYYHGYGGELAGHLLDTCLERNLIPCGGSDFHGIDGKSEAGLGRVDVPMTTAERLYAAAGRTMP
jgi:predicted metal-dependent phosphoesterase TrpH